MEISIISMKSVCLVGKITYFNPTWINAHLIVHLVQKIKAGFVLCVNKRAAPNCPKGILVSKKAEHQNLQYPMKISWYMRNRTSMICSKLMLKTSNSSRIIFLMFSRREKRNGEFTLSSKIVDKTIKLSSL